MNKTNRTSSQSDARARQQTSPALQRAANHRPMNRPRGAVNPLVASPETLRLLQRWSGNHRANRWIQTRLTVGPADDPYEREAERMAAQVAGASSAAPTADRSSPPPVQTAAQQPEVGREGGQVSDHIERALASNKGSGTLLPAPTRASMEQHFGADFSGVRVHTGHQASALNQQLDALAFTHGADIYIGEGQYNPASSDGRRLLAHELTHVVQQGAARSLAAQRLPRTGQRLPAVQRFSFKSLFGRRPKLVPQGGRKMTREEAGNVPSARDIETRYQSARQTQLREGPGFWHEDPAQMDRALQEQREQMTLASLRDDDYRAEIGPAPYTGPTLPANVPLTGADLKAARRMIYDAALQTLDNIPQEDDPARAQRLASLREALERERTTVPIRDEESLLSRIAAGDKESLKQVISKDLLDQLAIRIAEASGQEAQVVEQQAHATLVQMVNTSGRWAPFAKQLDLPGGAYTSQFTPVNQAFDPTFAAYGTTGYASMSAHLPVSEQAPLEQRTRTTNAWYTQFRSGDTVSGDILFEAFRSGSFSEKGVKDPEQRAQLARQKAYDLLKAMAVQYLKSREPDDQQAILQGQRTPTITVVSTALLTSFLGKLDHKLLQVHADAFESFHGQEVEFDIIFGGQPQRVKVRFNIINFNKAVNEFRWFGASRSSQQLKMNRQAIQRLREFKAEGLRLLEEKLTSNRGKIAEMGETEEAELLRQQNQALMVQIEKVNQLWARIEKVSARYWRLFSGSGSGYELPALVSNLAYQLGAMVHYNCMSGKDRTGMADVEAKLLAYQMDQRVKEAQESGVSLDRANLVPKYNKFTEGDAEAATRLMFESGNLDIQQINTGVAGYKVRGAMAGLVSGGRLGKILSTERGQSALRKYLGVDEQISLKAKTFTKAVNALSIFTGA